MSDQEPTIDSRRIYEGRVVNLRVDTIRLPNGRTSLREIVEHRGAAVIVPLDGQGNVVLVRQYRKAAEEMLLEAPAGTLEPGENPVQCAQRELQEEVRYAAERLRPLPTFWSAPGFSTERMYPFLATGLHPAPRQQDEDEDVEPVVVPLSRVPQMIQGGEIRDAKSIVALLMVLYLYKAESSA